MDVNRTSYRPCLLVGFVTATAGVFFTRRAFATTRANLFPTPKNTHPSTSPIRRVSCAVSTSAASGSSAPSPRVEGKVDMYGGGTGVTVPSQGTATAAIIFMHGLGDTANGWAPAFPLPGLAHVRTVLPTAEIQAVSLNGGMPMPSWFDLHGLDENAVIDADGISAGVARVERIIDAVVAGGIPAERVVVAGFSQGGALALTTALRSTRRLAGVVALSTWLPLYSQYPALLGEAAKDIPFFSGHGKDDKVVPLKFGKMSVDHLKQLGVDISMSEYAGLTHSASQSELEDVKDFVARVLPPL